MLIKHCLLFILIFTTIFIVSTGNKTEENKDKPLTLSIRTLLFSNDAIGNGDPCPKNPCINGGSCSVDGDSFKCKCNIPFYGDNCEKANNQCCGHNSNCTIGVNGTECHCLSGFYKVNKTCQICDCGTNGFCEVVVETIRKCTCDELFNEVDGKCVALPQMATWKIVVIVLSVFILTIFFAIAAILIKKPDWVENYCQRR